MSAHAALEQSLDFPPLLILEANTPFNHEYNLNSKRLLVAHFFFHFLNLKYISRIGLFINYIYRVRFVKKSETGCF